MWGEVVGKNTCPNRDCRKARLKRRPGIHKLRNRKVERRKKEPRIETVGTVTLGCP